MKKKKIGFFGRFSFCFLFLFFVFIFAFIVMISVGLCFLVYKIEKYTILEKGYIYKVSLCVGLKIENFTANSNFFF